MSIIKRLLEKYGKDEKKVKGEDREVLKLLKSFVPGPSDGTDETPDNMPDGDDQYRDDPIPTTTRKRRKKDG